MTRLNTINPETATGDAASLLTTVKKHLGIVPNLTKVMANAPSVLKSYLEFSGALSQGTLSAQLREKLAVFVAQANDCDYCLAAHVAIGKGKGISADELAGNRRGISANAKDAAALRFAKALIDTRGAVSDEELQAVRQAGFDDGAIAEITGHVALNIFTNYFNRLAQTDIDFPKV